MLYSWYGKPLIDNKERFNHNLLIKLLNLKAMNEFLGPLGWRKTSTESGETRAAAPTRNSIFASAPKTKKSSPSPSAGVSTSRWVPLPYPNPWSKNYYQMKFHHNLQQFRDKNENSSHYNQWKNYLKSSSMWG